MKVVCLKCGKAYKIPDEKLPMGKKVFFPCPNCQEKIQIDMRSGTISGDQPFSGAESSQVADPKRKKGSNALKEKILKTLKDLPAMPQVVIKAREIMADEDSGIKDIVKVLETDQAITARILKVANSAYYGMSGKISNIQHASVVLGYKTIGELITVAASSSLLNKVLTGYGHGSGELWHHSMSVGIGSRILAARKNQDLEDTAFSAGLIHDAGKLVLDKYVEQRRDDFDEIMEHGRETFMTAENRVFGFDHAEIGFDVCKCWSIPHDIGYAIKFHHAPHCSENSELAYVVYLADAIVNMSQALAKMDGMGAEIEVLMYMIDERG